MTEINQAELDAALQDSANWSVLDQTLYKLCREHPGHADGAGANAKLWLIGRGFATRIEQQIKSKGGQGSSMLALCEHFHTNYGKIDEVMGTLAEVEEPLDERKLRTIVAGHGSFCRLLRPVVRKGITPRSFAAKYLHFHCPAVPIYDSYAAWKLTRLCRWRSSFNVYTKPKAADDDYNWFVLRFWHLYQAVRRIRPRVTVRLLDMYLLW